jgi:hypothetical protein
VIREEKIKKDQAINKLAEMMMRKDLQVRNRQVFRIRIRILNPDPDPGVCLHYNLEKRSLKTHSKYRYTNIINLLKTVHVF